MRQKCNSLKAISLFLKSEPTLPVICAAFFVAHLQVKPFIKCVNYNHIMPTRYQLDVELKSIVTADVISGSNPTARQNARKEVKKVFEDK